MNYKNLIKKVENNQIKQKQTSKQTKRETKTNQK